MCEKKYFLSFISAKAEQSAGLSCIAYIHAFKKDNNVKNQEMLEYAENSDYYGPGSSPLPSLPFSLYLTH